MQKSKSTNRFVKNISKEARSYLYPFPRERRQFLNQFVINIRGQKRYREIGKENDKSMYMNLRVLFREGKECRALTQEVLIPLEDYANLLIYHVTDGLFCFNHLLYRNSVLYTTIDGQLIVPKGLPYHIELCDIKRDARELLFAMDKKGLLTMD